MTKELEIDKDKKLDDELIDEMDLIDDQLIDEINEIDEIVSIDEIEEIKEVVYKHSTDDSLNQYYKSIAPYSPLKLEEEIELGKKIKQGDKDALKKLLLSNLKFVVSIAMRYRNTTVPIGDLINQGNIGLLEAAKRYDYTRGVKFITYAVWWIKQAIVHGLSDHIGSVRLPLKQANILFKINAATERLSKELKRPPMIEEISNAIGVSIQDIEVIYRVSKGTISLDNLISDDNNDTYVDKLKSHTMSVEDEIMQKMLKNSLDEIVSELDTREANIISMRFGLDSEKPMTLEEVGDKLKISRERVRQLENRALDKLKKKAIKRKLSDFLN